MYVAQNALYNPDINPSELPVGENPFNNTALPLKLKTKLMEGSYLVAFEANLLTHDSTPSYSSEWFLIENQAKDNLAWSSGC